MQGEDAVAVDAGALVEESRRWRLPVLSERFSLRRLARHGDRVHIVVDERLRALVPIDSSVFNLVLARTAD